MKGQIPVHFHYYFIFPVQQNFEIPVHNRIYQGSGKIDSGTFQYIAKRIQDKKQFLISQENLKNEWMDGDSDSVNTRTDKQQVTIDAIAF